MANKEADKDSAARQHEILSKPLPQILDEIMGSVELANKAAADARQAAEDVMRRFRKVFLKMVDDITGELGEGKD